MFRYEDKVVSILERTQDDEALLMINEVRFLYSQYALLSEVENEVTTELDYTTRAPWGEVIEKRLGVIERNLGMLMNDGERRDA